MLYFYFCIPYNINSLPDNNKTYLKELWGLNEIKHMKDLIQSEIVTSNYNGITLPSKWQIERVQRAFVE